MAPSLEELWLNFDFDFTGAKSPFLLCADWMATVFFYYFGVPEYNDWKLAVISGLASKVLIWIIEPDLAHTEVTASAGIASCTVGFSSIRDYVGSGKSALKRSRIESAALEETAPNV